MVAEVARSQSTRVVLPRTAICGGNRGEMVEGVQSGFCWHGVDRVEELLAIAIKQRGAGRLEEQTLFLCRQTSVAPETDSIGLPLTTIQGRQGR